ncbi:hypothetical protein A2U01_0060386, partial [Trifolium medium]|nr:hypothetical protein [Trifolium medium]
VLNERGSGTTATVHFQSPGGLLMGRGRTKEYCFRVRGTLGRYSRGYVHGYQYFGGPGGPHPRPVEKDLHLVGLGNHPNISDRIPAARLPDAVHRP